MKVFLDENMPQGLVRALRALGHEVESVHSLVLRGTSNGELYRLIAQDYDLCFSKDEDFARKSRGSAIEGRVKVIHVTLKQQPQQDYGTEFLSHFARTDWTMLANGDSWP